MKTKLIIIFLIVFVQKNISQSYTPLRFKNYVPLWARISKTDKLPLNLQGYELEQGFGNAPLVVQDGIMYNLYNIVNSYYDGYYFEAVDLNDGKLIWEDSNIAYERNKRKIGLHPSISGQAIQLPIFAENDPTDINLWPLWFYAKAEKNTYDLRTGLKIDSTSNIRYDSTAKALGNYYSFFQNKFRDRIYVSGDNYKYIINKSLFNQSTLEGLIQYESILLSPTGLILDSTGLDLITKYPVSFNNIIDLEDQTMFSFSLSESGSDSTYQSQPFYHILNRELEVLEQGDLSEKLPKSRNNKYTISYVDLFNFNILTYEQSNINEVRYTYLSRFDRKGNLLETIDLKPLLLINNQGISNVVQSTIVSENKIIKTLFCVGAFNNGKYEFIFYKTNGKGTYKEVKRLIAINEKKEAIGIRRICQIGNNVLCQFSYNDNETKSNPVPLWNCWEMLSGVDLEVNIEEYSDKRKENLIEVYPNPAVDKLVIENKFKNEGIALIFDSNGKCVQYFSKIVSEINIEYFNSGIYYLQTILNNGKSTVSKFFKKD